MIFNSFKILSQTFCLTGMVLFSCQLAEENDPPLFTRLSPQSTGVTFSNDITETETMNILEYLYMYNGGGVAVGDINNDGWADIYFAANQQSNKLYLNKGNRGNVHSGSAPGGNRHSGNAPMQFEDITEKAGVGGDIGLDRWTTGVTMADVNHDGWLDIYVCQVDSFQGLEGTNQLFINNQDGTFSEKAAAYGLALSSYAQQAAFFDYDRDGDLDMYLLNQAVHTPSSYKEATLRNKRDSLAGDRFYENVDGKFHDVSEQTGIYGGSMGYGLALTIGDIDNNGYPDIYVANDFHENDYLYYNQGDGSFQENMVGSMGHNSTFSMGNDMADFNNDELLDIISLDMKPFDETILKSSSGVDPYNIYEFKLSYGYFYQYSRNMLHLNQGHLFTDSAVQFSEIGQLSGVSATDWSWSALFADLDNDGLKDLYITNGIPRRPNDLDYVKFTSNETRKVHSTNQLGLIATLPEGKVTNKVYKNRGLAFEDKSSAWGLDLHGVSHGAAYADLDNDGDLDLIVNNLLENAAIYENHSSAITKNNFLQVRCKGDSLNPWGIGARMTLETTEGTQMQELYPTKGWLSSMSPELHFGLGNADRIEKLTVRWSDGKIQTLENVQINQTLVVYHADAVPRADLQKAEDQGKNNIFHNITDQSGIDFQHRENYFIDFVVEQLIPHFLSTQGPKVAVGDVNQDGLDDFYIGGAKGQAGALYLQQNGPPFFKMQPTPPFEQHKLMEDTDARLFDADNDGDLDLYVVSGGGEPDKGKILQDRLYLNDGTGNFDYATQALPGLEFNGACVVPFDLNEDGHLDLFVGAHSVPYSYGLSPDSRVLINNGEGQFTDKTEQLMPDALELGMVTDAVWLEESRELVVAGEWMPITLFNFSGEVTKTELPHTHGWWNTLHAADMDGDGDMDLLAGNRGENSDIQASAEKPANLYIHDFDGNTSTDPILTYYKQGEEWVYPGLDQLAAQVVQLKKIYTSYQTFAESPFSNVFPPDELEKAVHKQVHTFQSVYIENLGEGKYQIKPLPIEAQFSSIHAFATADFDGDGHTDVLAAGNFYGNQPSMGRDDASYGLLMKGNGKGEFTAIPPRKSGFSVYGEVRSIALLQGRKDPFILVSRNNAATRLFNYSIR